MKLADDPATRVVALKIIELAQRGVRDEPTLSEMTLKELKHYLPYAYGFEREGHLPDHFRLECLTSKKPTYWHIAL